MVIGHCPSVLQLIPQKSKHSAEYNIGHSSDTNTFISVMNSNIKYAWPVTRQYTQTYQQPAAWYHGREGFCEDAKVCPHNRADTAVISTPTLIQKIASF